VNRIGDRGKGKRGKKVNERDKKKRSPVLKIIRFRKKWRESKRICHQKSKIDAERKKREGEKRE
jgi:hypothetical protein